MKILVIGDSHTKVFQYIKKNKLCNTYNFDIILIGGATAQGMVNPNSKTNAMPIFTKKVKMIKPNYYNKILIMLGEVDCGFIIWLRSEKYNISVDEQINISINNLFKFLKNTVLQKFKNNDIIVCGSILPTIKDNTDKNILGGARADIKTSQLERTYKTLEYNEILKKRCIEHNFNYIDITNDTINNNTHIINDYYLSDNKNDHHLSDDKTYKLWLNKLNTLFEI